MSSTLSESCAAPHPVVAGAASAATAASGPAPSGEHPARPRALPLLLVRLRGSQAQMGEQHGRLLRAHGGYEQTLAFYPRLVERLLGGDGLEGALLRLGEPAVRLLLRRLERARPRELRARTRAFFEALGLGRQHATALGVMDVFQNLVGLAGRWRLGPFARQLGCCAAPACSTLVVWGRACADGQLRHARNFDFPGAGIWDRAPAVVLCEPEQGLRYGFVTTRGADTPGVTAFNEAGLTLSAHTRFHREVRFDGAAVVDLGHEIIRRAESIADAIAIARERPVASSWGLAVSSARERRAVVLETTGAQVEVVEPEPGAPYLACTNRYHHPHTRRGEVVVSPAWTVSCSNRERRLSEAARTGALDAAALARLLGDHRDPADPETERATGGIVSQLITVQSVVCEPEAAALLLSVGTTPTGWGPYARVRWAWDGPAGAWSWNGEQHAAAPAGFEPALALPMQPPARFAGGPGARAYAELLAAARAWMDEHDAARSLVHLERALAHDPDELGCRFLAAVLRLRAGEPEAALAHIEHALARERVPFRRGQLLLWGSRAAALLGQAERARRMREELLGLSEPLLAGHRSAAAREEQQPYPRRRLRRLTLNFMIADAF
ncbi:MAG: hypothetical protein KatS3mg102_1856 [Planctomycetota bacterium]|nr:MAG: hypothetical protein KatS3mg102_1856 [Planctomycetota bacterium]